MDLPVTEDKKSTQRVKLVVGISLAVLAVLVAVGLVLVYGETLTRDLNGKFVTTNYTDAGVRYELLYYRNSIQKSANDIASITQGGKKPIAGSPEVLESPPLGKYGTSVAIFMAPIPANRQPLLANNSCSSLSGLVEVFTVTMRADHSTGIVCGSKMSGNLQVEYVFQFAQRGQTYNGFVLLPFDWGLVSKSSTEAKAFLQYASLTHYNDDLKQIIGSITVQ
jgi:hypothetical protein